MEILTIGTLIGTLALGVAIGMYISSQIEKHIDKNIGAPDFKIRNESYFTSRNERIKKESHGKLGGNLEDVHMRDSIKVKDQYGGKTRTGALSPTGIRNSTTKDHFQYNQINKKKKK